MGGGGHRNGERVCICDRLAAVDSHISTSSNDTGCGGLRKDAGEWAGEVERKWKQRTSEGSKVKEGLDTKEGTSNSSSSAFARFHHCR